MSNFIHVFLYSIVFIGVFADNLKEECDKIHTSGTGTVLFNPTDVYKTCWSQEEVAILTARIILEDVIPDKKAISIKCNDDIEDLVTYFKDVIERIRTNTKARKRHILLLALTDLLGGLLHHAILPMARKAYYAGAVDYVYMETVIQLYEEVKWFLRTNGQGWTKPMLIIREVKVPLIDVESSISKSDNESCCQNVMFYEHEPLRTKRTPSVEKGIYFPLPFFDAKVRPTAIALPLKHFSLRNIESKRAAYAVMKFFLAAEQCLKAKSAKPELVSKFQNNLYTWIAKEVIPKLDDDKFYSAFGGIMRVQGTLKALGAALGTRICNTDVAEEEVGAIPGIGCSSRRNKILLIAMLVIIIAWFVIGTCFICYRMRNNRLLGKSPGGDTKTSRSTSSFSSSKWSSMLSRSSSKTDKTLCKCCESSMSERSTPGLSSTSEYDSEKTRRTRRSLKSFRPKKFSQSSPCVCPDNGPAVIDTKHSMKVLPSIAEMSEHSVQNKKISFADQSSSEGLRVCVPPWVTAKNSVPCPKLSGKVAAMNTSKSTTVETQGVQNPSQQSIGDRSNQSFEEPLAESTMRQDSSAGKSTPDVYYVEEDDEGPAIKEEKPIKDDTIYDYHLACHSSLSGNYDLYHRVEPDKPYVFGYDFQTTTSSDVSDEDDSKY